MWDGRFKSLIVERGETLVNCLAYVELNPVRADLVARPEDYRWNSIAYHIQANNKDNFLSIDFGFKEFGVKKKDRIQKYRRYIYEAGAVKDPKKRHAKTIDNEILESERKKKYKLGRVDRFKYRTRYFTDSGIIGSKAFVFKTYLEFKDLFQSSVEKKPNPVKGLDGMYSLKRLSEIG